MTEYKGEEAHWECSECGHDFFANHAEVCRCCGSRDLWYASVSKKDKEDYKKITKKIKELNKRLFLLEGKIKNQFLY